MDTVCQLINTSAERFGDRPALIEPNEDGGMFTPTYHELWERAQGFAGYLQEQQVEKNDKQATCSTSASTEFHRLARKGFSPHAHPQSEATRGGRQVAGDAAGGIGCSIWSRPLSGI